MCPWNHTFAQERTERAFASRDGLDSRDVRALARDFLAMSQTKFIARFKGSAMNRAKRRGRLRGCLRRSSTRQCCRRRRRRQAVAFEE